LRVAEEAQRDVTQVRKTGQETQRMTGVTQEKKNGGKRRSGMYPRKGNRGRGNRLARAARGEGAGRGSAAAASRCPRQPIPVG